MGIDNTWFGPTRSTTSAARPRRLGPEQERISGPIGHVAIAFGAAGLDRKEPCAGELGQARSEIRVHLHRGKVVIVEA